MKLAIGLNIFFQITSDTLTEMFEILSDQHELKLNSRKWNRL